MRVIFLMVALVPACGIWQDGGQTGEMALRPDGPPVDMNAALRDVRDVFEGEFTGAVADAPGPADATVEYRPCPDAGARFTLDLNIARPICTDPDRPEADCDLSDVAAFPLDGLLALGDAPPIALEGYIEVWSKPADLVVLLNGIYADADAYPASNFDFTTSDSTMLSEIELMGLSWQRRLSEEYAPVTIWEVCILPLAEGT